MRTCAGWLVAGMVVAAGCGSRGGGGDGDGLHPDAGGSDARSPEPDAAATDAGFRPAACELDPDQAPTCAAPAPDERVAIDTYPGIAVLFHDPDGCLVCRTAADGEGLAEAALPDGGMATIIDLDSSAAFTVGGLSPGDRIRIGYPPEPGNGNARTFQVSAPALAGASRYIARVGPCEASSTSLPFDLVVDDSCLDGDGSVSILLVATDDAGERAGLGWIADATVPAVGESAAVSLTAWATTSSDLTFAVSSIPDDIGSVSATTGWAGDLFAYDCCSASSAGAATVDLLVSVPSLPGAPGLYGVTLERAMGHDTDIDFILRVEGALESPVAIDVASDFLPHIETAAHDGHADRPVFTWVTSAEPSEADLLVVQAEWGTFEWNLALPPDTAQPVAFPNLPSDLRPGPSLGRYAFVMYADVSAVTSWAEAKADAYAFFYLLFLPKWQMSPGFSYRVSVFDDLDLPGP